MRFISLRSLAFGTGLAVLGLANAGPAHAQSTSASISGQAQPGDLVLVENAETGFRRELPVNGKGRYQFRNLAIGTFTVTVKHADGTVDPPKQVNLRVGMNARIQ